MKISWKWLGSLVDLHGMTPAELGHRLTMCGLEVEGIESFGSDPALDTVVVGHIQSIEQHPDADRLVVCQVETGEHGRKQIVCGAKNMVVGDKVPLALPGTKLPGGIKIKKGRLRGVDSEGMLCSPEELELPADVDGLLILGADAVVGSPVLAALDLADTVIEIAVTPNRPDALSHLGVARDVAALTGAALTWPRFARDWRAECRGEAVSTDPMPWDESGEGGAPIESLVSVDLRDEQGCPRYAVAVVEGLKIGPSPDWMRNRLMAIGQRPINNLVDVTNYVLHECGQPLHAFDLDKLVGGLVIRRAEDGEQIETIDGQTRTLVARDVIIADGQGPVAVAGVMGGAGSEVGESTTRVALECANFHPTFVRKTARRLGLHSESSHRFERGVDPAGVPYFLFRAIELLLATQEGSAARPRLARGVLDLYPRPRARRQVDLSVAEYTRVIGTAPGAERMAHVLDALDLPAALDGEVFHVDVPTFRPDIERPVDLVEEIARIEGFDAVPAALPPGLMGFSHAPRTDAPDLHATIESRDHADAITDVRRHLVGRGLFEAVNYNFVASGLSAALGFPASDVRAHPIQVRNPLSEEMNVMRTSLVTGLLKNLRHNRAHRVTGANLFEVGHVYLRRDMPDAPVSEAAGGPRWEAHVQPLAVGAIFADPRAEHYTGGCRYDLSDVRSVASDVVGILSRGSTRMEGWTEDVPGFLHPLAAGLIRCDGASVGWFGALHPDFLTAEDIQGEVMAFELDASRLLALRADLPTMKPIARYPASQRDFALVVDADLPFAAVEGALESFVDRRLVEHSLFDLYSGEQLAATKKSLAIKVTFQDPRKTLSDKAIMQLQERLVAHLRTVLGAELR